MLNSIITQDQDGLMEIHFCLTAMMESICAIFQPTEQQMELFIEMFVGRLPDYIRNSLAKDALAA